MRRRQDEGMADAPHSQHSHSMAPNVEYVSSRLHFRIAKFSVNLILVSVPFLS